MKARAIEIMNLIIIYQCQYKKTNIFLYINKNLCILYPYINYLICYK